jgi:predicted nucleic acid-binding protein
VKVALDTNVLAYAEGINDRAKRDCALELIGTLPRGTAVIPVQAMGELFNVLVRKAGKSRSNARDRLLSWSDSFPTVETSTGVMLAAVDLASDHRMGIWDAVIMAAAAHAGCRLLLSEDLQEGFTWSSVTVVNPFSQQQHPLLRALLTGES